MQSHLTKTNRWHRFWISAIAYLITFLTVSNSLYMTGAEYATGLFDMFTWVAYCVILGPLLSLTFILFIRQLTKILHKRLSQGLSSKPTWAIQGSGTVLLIVLALKTAFSAHGLWIDVGFHDFHFSNSYQPNIVFTADVGLVGLFLSIGGLYCIQHFITTLPPNHRLSLRKFVGSFILVGIYWLLLGLHHWIAQPGPPIG